MTPHYLYSPFSKGFFFSFVAVAALISCGPSDTDVSQTKFKVDGTFRNSFYYVKQKIDRVCLRFEEGYVEDYLNSIDMTKKDLLRSIKKSFHFWLYQIHLVNSSVSPHVTFGCDAPYLAKITFKNSFGRSHVKTNWFSVPKANIYLGYSDDFIELTDESPEREYYRPHRLSSVLTHEVGHLSRYLPRSRQRSLQSIKHPARSTKVNDEYIFFGERCYGRRHDGNPNLLRSPQSTRA